MTSVIEFARQRIDGTYTIDEWGLDPALIELCNPVMRLRWSVEVDGGHHIPDDGPAILVSNQRFGMSEPFVLAHAVRSTSARLPRIVGVPDVALVGPWLRRFGGVLARPDEVSGLLRAGHVVGVTLDRSRRHRQRAGRPPSALLTPAVTLDVPVVPVALTGREVGRHWQVVIGPPIEPPSTRGPLAVDDLADRARAGVQALLDQLHPPRWFGN
jgi:1-acyl-sn-glycerol-3-phosphate acyltransferase